MSKTKIQLNTNDIESIRIEKETEETKEIAIRIITNKGEKYHIYANLTVIHNSQNNYKSITLEELSSLI